MAGSSKKAIYAALVGNGLIAITKFAAAAYTGSAAMMSEGIHSLVDTGNQVLLLFGIRQSGKPASADYPFGHGKEIYFWSFIVAMLIFALGGAVSVYKGWQHLSHPAEISNLRLNYIVLAFAMVFETGALWVAFREFNRSRGDRGFIEAVTRGKDPTLFVVVFEDSAAMLGLIIAMVGLFIYQVTGNPIGPIDHAGNPLSAAAKMVDDQDTATRSAHANDLAHHRNWVRYNANRMKRTHEIKARIRKR